MSPRPAWTSTACCRRILPREWTALRQWFEKRGLSFGPAFTGLTRVHTAEGTDETVLAEISLPRRSAPQHAGYRVHPALLSACFQSVEAHPAEQVANGTA